MDIFIRRITNVTNGTIDLQINTFSTSVKISLDFLTECHVTFIRGCHMVWYLGFFGAMPFKKKKKKDSWGG
jgi:hypothetical protein